MGFFTQSGRVYSTQSVTDWISNASGHSRRSAMAQRFARFHHVYRSLAETSQSNQPVSIWRIDTPIVQCQFNDGGAAQLCYDIQSNLIPLFSQMTSRPESYFRELKDSCTLLRLPKPITTLLLDTLALAVQDDGNASVKCARALSNGKLAFKDQGIKKLSVEDSLSVLRRRIM